MADNKNAQAGLEEIESHVPEQLHPILEAAFKYQKQIAIGVIAIIGVAALYAGITAYNSKAMDTATAKLGKVLIETSGDEKISQLEGLLNSAPSSAKAAVMLELAESCMRSAKYEQAADYWNRLIGESEGNLKFVASMGKAKALTMGGKPGEAVTVLKALVGAAPAEYTVSVNRQLAVAAEQDGDTATALAAYKVLSEKSTGDKPYIDYKIAQLEVK
jgi:predicted Zn-dependent protease